MAEVYVEVLLYACETFIAALASADNFPSRLSVVRTQIGTPATTNITSLFMDINVNSWSSRLADADAVSSTS